MALGHRSGCDVSPDALLGRFRRADVVANQVGAPLGCSHTGGKCRRGDTVDLQYAPADRLVTYRAGVGDGRLVPEKLTRHFDEIFKSEGLHGQKLPRQSPNLNAYAER